jgi:hypothetical protein
MKGGKYVVASAVCVQRLILAASDCAWVLTHLDDADIQESWSFPARKQDVLFYLNQAGFPEVWRRVLALTPEDGIVDYVSRLIHKPAKCSYLLSR